MRREIAIEPRRRVTQFRPEKTRSRVARLDGDIVTFRKLKQWDKLDEAAREKMAEQADFIAVWAERVGINQSPGRGKTNAIAGSFSVAEAEAAWGIRQQIVSRWRIALENPEGYRQRIVLGAHRAAFLEPLGSSDPAMLRPQPDRTGPDFWATTADLITVCVNHVLRLLPGGPIWECASGNNRFANAIQKAGRKVYTSDLYPQDDRPPRDFLNCQPPAPHVIAVTNPPYNQLNEFIARGLALFDTGKTDGLVLLLRHDHLTAAERVEALNRATFEVHCNWRPVWIEGSKGNPRHSFCWVGWMAGKRQPPRYVETERRELTC